MSPLVFGCAFADKISGEGRLVANAMLAAEHALSQGIAWHVHEPSQDEAIDREVSLLGELDEAITKGDLLAHYQPKLNL
ncbi:hypothetical protein KRR38_32835 [Novosphingobium sp. G106]|uniref:hypothetical protein n=1 Tax=Novosphingobium sp. G106 TaxID=2849500 RepID=UPI001C2DEB9D|nr:hypothetical protein [Novosphingobium sp. G106]MBV1692317.1 hypothetical protein [Novosphingobium sp. G106]